MPGHENQITEMEAALKKPCSVGSDTSVITVSVDPDDNVKTIKEKVKEQKQIPIAGYSLKKGATVLDDEKKISTQGVKANDELTMDHKEITVKVDGITDATESFKVDPDNKLSALKEKIKTKNHLQPADYTLKKGATVLDDTKTMVS